MNSATECNNNELNALTDSIMCKVQTVQQKTKESRRCSFRLTPTATYRQLIMVILANLGIVATGMGLGFPAVSLNQLTDSDQDFHMTSSQASWFASINAISCPLGGLLSGYLLDSLGRKKTILSFNLISIFSWGLMIFRISSNNNVILIQIMISRFLIGISTGLASSPAGVYSAEICHSSLRGRLTLGTSIATAFGIMLIYILGYFIRNDYQLISTIVCGYSIISIICCFPIRESPVWLLSKNMYDESLNNLKYFRGVKKNDNTDYDEIKNELDELQRAVPHRTSKREFKETIGRPEIYKPLLIMIGFFGFQQFSGIFVVIVYAVQFSIEAGVSIDPLLCAILIGLTRIVTTFLVGIILDKWGRRPPAMISASGMAISMFLLAASTWFPEVIGKIPYITVISIVTYIFTSTLGLMTLPFSMISEVFPPSARGQCAGITICCGYLMSFVAIKLYPGMVSSIGNENVFAFYGLVSLLAIVYVYIYLPETKGKTLKQIEDHFKNKSSSGSQCSEIEAKQLFKA
ncbi:hypothetical protein ACFFRR_001283 [Megaselia abdita]